MIRTGLQLVLLGALFALCRWAVARSAVPVPAGLVALVLLTALLLTRAVPERAVGGGADALLRILPALFIPSGIAVLRELQRSQRQPPGHRRVNPGPTQQRRTHRGAQEHAGEHAEANQSCPRKSSSPGASGPSEMTSTLSAGGGMEAPRAQRGHLVRGGASGPASGCSTGNPSAATSSGARKVWPPPVSE